MQPSPRAGLSPETSDCGPRFCAEQVMNTFSLFSGWPSNLGNLGLLIRRLLRIYIQAVYTKLACMDCSALPMLQELLQQICSPSSRTGKQGTKWVLKTTQAVAGFLS